MSAWDREAGVFGYIDEERDPAVLTNALAHVARSLGRFFAIEGAWGHGSWGAEVVKPPMRDALLDELDLAAELIRWIRVRVEDVASYALTPEEIRAVRAQLASRDGLVDERVRELA